MSLTGGLLFFFGTVVFPGWLLVIGRRLRYRGRRIRGAFWGGIVGHLIGDGLFLGVLLTPPLALPSGDDTTLPLLLVVPALLSAMVGAAIGRRRSSRRAFEPSGS